ncbi:hypothetical protein TRSC58_01616 [Trypanosoma rangeli SC58]|uniref:Uncharacterized protein n=1 Tax=Trypanosoma rangeli SC58 TaxID=429131 RepID=A0A061JBM1_TRYRA|nr:hypothetical protein TRSC58_01616 [Trypanosoma rangeli SC58]
MDCPTHFLSSSIIALLTEHGIHHARVTIDLLPGDGRTDVDGGDRKNDGKRDARSTDINVIFNGWGRVLLAEGEPAQQPLEPQKILPPPRAHSPTGNIASRTSPLVCDNDAGESKEHHHSQPAQRAYGEDEAGLADKMMDSTTRPEGAQRRESPVTTAHFAPSHAGKVSGAAAENSSQGAASNGSTEDKQGSEEVPHEPETAPPASGGGRPLHVRQAVLLPLDTRRDVKSQPVLPAVPPAPHVRKTSVVLVEQQKAVAPPIRTTPTGPTPVFSILNTEHGEQMERTSSTNSTRKASSVQLVESQPVEELKHQPHHAEAREDARCSSILVNGTAPKQEQRDPKWGGANAEGEVRFPPVLEQGGHALQRGNSNANDSGKTTMSAPPQVEAWKLGSKQRLQEMLQQQREMEQNSMISRARHEEILGEAEKFLQEVEQKARAAKHTEEDSPLLPFVSLRTGPAYSANSAGAHCSSPRCRSPSASSPNSMSGIKVVKFTMPAGGKAKEEVINQLRTSPGGAQHLSSKDKYSMLLREQDNMLRQKEEKKEEYNKLVEQAVAFHEQQKALKQMHQEEECEDEDENDEPA